MSVSENTPPKQVQDRSNLVIRVITAVIGGPLVLYITYLGGIPFILIGLLLAVLSLLEFYAMGRERHIPGHTVIGFPAVLALVILFINREYGWCVLLVIGTAAASLVLELIQGNPVGRWKRVVMTIGGLLYAGLPSALLIQIRALPLGLLWIYLIFVLTWSTDSFAYIGGRLWGRRKLAPRISPKKTVEGAVVGLISGFVLGLLLLVAASQFTPSLLPLLIIAPPLAVVGDLFESWLKRQFHVGDSHLTGFNIVPGHGGVMDRTDSMIWVASFFYVWIVIFAINL
ncbi:MAG: phosphatidate cytidylyltransferase [Anaerolineae bacterium]